MGDTFLYFAYGSNMLTRRLRAPKRAPSARVEGTGYVTGHRFTFDKVSTDKQGRRSGKCDMEATGDRADLVHGVLFSIDRTDEKRLDRAEGLDHGYRKDDKVDVVTTDGTKTAVAYIATEKDQSVRPYDWYKAFVIEGAVEHGLPDDYIEALRAVESEHDPDPVRRAENEALLSGS